MDPNGTLSMEDYNQVQRLMLPVFPLSMVEGVGHLNLFTLRRFFYLVTPEETTFASVNDVPNWLEHGSGMFLFFMLFECLACIWLGRAHYWNANDMMTSVLGGQLSLFFKLFNRAFGLWLYTTLYDNYRLIDLPAQSTATWLLCFFSQDLLYYLWHRAMHEVSFLWSFHQMHHSSQYYNVSTAIRQGVVQEFASNLFECVQAFFIPPQIYLVHAYLTILNQVWVHTRLIPKLGVIEWLLNTPSHHRVHHGRNAYCLDKNYAGTLIIWDRLFGTFSEERDEEPVAYGLVTNVNSFDQLYIQLFYFKYTLWDKPWVEMAKVGSLKDQLLSYIYPIGWTPGTKLKRFIWWRLADTEEGIPEIEDPIEFHDPQLPRWFQLYTIFTYAIQLVFFNAFMRQYPSLSTWWALGLIAYQVVLIQIIGYMLDAKLVVLLCRRGVARLELYRTAIIGVLAVASPVYRAYGLLHLGCAAVWATVFANNPDFEIEEVKKVVDSSTTTGQEEDSAKMRHHGF